MNVFISIKWPLSEFQHTRADKNDTRKLLRSMNTALGEERLNESHLEEAYETWWPKLEGCLQEITMLNDGAPLRSQRDILEEALELIRKTSNTVSVIHPYEPPSTQEVRTLIISFSRLVDRCDELDMLEPVRGLLCSIQSTIQHLMNRMHFSTTDAQFIYGKLNRTLLILNPTIGKFRKR
jgi:hypothetical protein